MCAARTLSAFYFGHKICDNPALCLALISANSLRVNIQGNSGAGVAKEDGTVNTAGTAVTWVSGPTFSTSWLGNSASIHIGPSGALVQYLIASVTDTTHLVLAGTGAGTQTVATYITGSPWDGNTNVSGYPCLNQTGRGQGDLLSGNFPNMIDASLSSGGIGTATLGSGGSGCNTGDLIGVTQGGASGGVLIVTGTGAATAITKFMAGSAYTIASGLATTAITGTCSGVTVNITGLAGWPNEALEPVYVFNNTWGGTGSFWVTNPLDL